MYGTQLIASMLNATMYGAAMTIAMKYFNYHSTGDTILVKGMVIVLIIILAKHLSIHLTAFVAQLFYATRIWWHSINAMSGIAQVIVIKQAGTSAEVFRKYNVISKLAVVRGGSATICDIVITASFSFIFRSNQSGINSAVHSLLQKFVVYAINRAAVTSVSTLLSLFSMYNSSMIPFHANTHRERC
ncbi:hypothetical protein BDQ17DRAFT_1329465 [Cyathus striatus]|nr:hypothetical protein BDQ17DRAFT_1329465 [Cyathus striatus]